MICRFAFHRIFSIFTLSRLNLNWVLGWLDHAPLGGQARQEGAGWAMVFWRVFCVRIRKTLTISISKQRYGGPFGVFGSACPHFNFCYLCLNFQLRTDPWKIVVGRFSRGIPMLMVVYYKLCVLDSSELFMAKLVGFVATLTWYLINRLRLKACTEWLVDDGTALFQRFFDNF